MPELPQRPSVEYLRKQAKTRERQRAIGLSRAQYEIAREHGFDSWPKLVHHVPQASSLEGIERALVLAHSYELARLLHADPTAVTAAVGALAPLLVLLRRSIGSAAQVYRCAALLLDAGADPDSHTIEWGRRGPDVRAVRCGRAWRSRARPVARRGRCHHRRGRVLSRRHHLAALIALPVVLYALAAWTAAATSGRRLPTPRIPRWAWLAYAAFFLIYTVVLRNLPWAPFTWFYVPNLSTAAPSP